MVIFFIFTILIFNSKEWGKYRLPFAKKDEVLYTFLEFESITGVFLRWVLIFIKYWYVKFLELLGNFEFLILVEILYLNSISYKRGPLNLFLFFFSIDARVSGYFIIVQIIWLLNCLTFVLLAWFSQFICR